jgi:hypothetical protein
LWRQQLTGNPLADATSTDATTMPNNAPDAPAQFGTNHDAY